MRKFLSMCLISTVCMLMLLGCSAKSGSTNTIEKKTKDSIVVVKNTTPEEAIKIYYMYQLDTDSEEFKSSIYPSNTTNIKLLNVKSKAYDVKKVSLNLIHSIDKRDNLSVALCSFKTSMSNIHEEKLDFEFLNLLNKNGSWYVITDLNSLNSTDQNTLQDMTTKLSDKSLQSEDVQKIAESQLKFDDKYSDFLESSGKKLEDYMKKEGIIY
ncbi:PBP1b-binding outer membrane lipoprotein LpoB [Clostridium pascui]|uniref:hypothetical protein n=1 Tax=Clostridium pascui TaxID=46609 RepID=UPI001959ACA6|nr:hypothetical protein [Clostridium pascui]MBM7869497.1 PBP1b-binding outer membrane lipoprotein LpoB [Clostridium pascui]